MHAPSATAADRDGAAKQIAVGIPLVHFPARLPLQATRAGPGWADAWGELTCNSVRGLPRGSDHFSELRADHVFAYAGPCCYSGGPVPAGNAVLYLYPHAEADRAGEVSPFDSGSLEDPAPKLQPWAAQSLDERWAFLRRHTAPLKDWRERFQAWLLDCYVDPWRYLESTPDPWSAGLPDQLSPPELLAHNGPAGRRLHDDSCGDRRAWTWEVRLHKRVSWRNHLQVLHVGAAANERANDLADDIERETGVRPEVRSLPHDALPDYFSLMEHSGEILRECIAP